MTLKERIENEREVNRPVDGKFTKKPKDAKTLRQWMCEGMCPKDGTTLRMYQMSHTQGYGYYITEDVRPMTPEELASYNSTPSKEKPKNKKQEMDVVSTLRKKKQCYIVTPEEWATKEIVVFDVETTGFYNTDEILQMSAADNHGHTYDQYVKPLTHFAWDKAMAVNHITPEMVDNSPTVVTLAPIWQSLFDHADYIIGHNVNFDIRMMRNIGVEIDPAKVIDTCKIHKVLCPDAENDKLETAVRNLASEKIKAQYADGAHSAIVDVLATLDVYHTFCKMIWEQQ